MQTSYSLRQTEAVAGQLADSGPAEVYSYPAAEAIPAGRVCVLVDGKLELPQDTTLANVVGVSLYNATAPAGGYVAGDSVPCVRRGRVFVEFTGTGATAFEAVKVKHASTDGDSQVQHRGKTSDAAADTDAGQETTVISGALFRGPGPSGLALLELNLP